jgi:glycine/D-amino acid oxidase-like deaminating enzyme
MTGVGLACFLRERGLKIVMLERGTVAGGATGRNVGFLVSGLGEHYARSIEFWGREPAAAITRLHLKNHSLLADIVAQHGIDCDYARDGSLVIAADEEEEDLLRRSHPLLLEDGFRCEFVEASQINKTLRALGFGGGLFNPSDGHVDPVGLIRGLAAVAQSGGVKFFEHTPVSQFRKAGVSWVAETEHGSVTTDLLFLASNAWTPKLLPEMELEPVRGQCMAIGPLGEPPITVPCYTNYGSEYWRGAGRYAILGGMRRAGNNEEVGYEDGVTEAVQSALDSFCRDHFPYLRSAPVTHRWSGIMSYTGDGLPLVGAVPHKGGMYLAAGYTGHGFGYAFLAAHWLVSLALDGSNEIPDLCRIDRTMRYSPSLKEI